MRERGSGSLFRERYRDRKTGQLKVCRTWMMKLWVGGKPVKRSARTTSRAVASQQLEQWKAQIRQGTYVPDADQTRFDNLAREVTRLPLHDYSGSAQGPQCRNRRMNRVVEPSEQVIVNAARRGSMIRKLVLALVILAMAAVPLPAVAGDGGHEGRHEFRGGERFERRERFEHFRQPFITFGFYPYPYYAYAPPACYWQPGYSVNQPYVDAWGRYTYVRQWVPAQYVCY